VFYMYIYFFPLIGFVFSWLLGSILFAFLIYPKRPIRILGITFQGLIYKIKSPLIKSLGNYLEQTVKHNDAISNALLSPDNLSTVLPTIEAKVAHFLELKLSEQLPAISMFVGKKTLDKVKNSLMQEIEILLPKAIEQYLNKFRSNFDGQKFAMSIVNEETENLIINTLKN